MFSAPWAPRAGTGSSRAREAARVRAATAVKLRRLDGKTSRMSVGQTWVSGEAGIRVPFLSIIDLILGTLPTEKETVEGHQLLGGLVG